MTHNISNGTYHDGGQVISKEEYEKRALYLKRIGEYARRVFARKCKIEELPEEYRMKVSETVRIMQMPSQEISEEEKARLEAEWEKEVENV